MRVAFYKGEVIGAQRARWNAHSTREATESGGAFGKAMLQCDASCATSGTGDFGLVLALDPQRYLPATARVFQT